MKRRCAWITDERMRRYHDVEWGMPVHRDRKHFEFLVLDANQAGLSWATVLRKRDAFRRAFEGFDYVRVARYGASQIRRLLADPGIIRNRQKIQSALTNARALLRVREEFGTFDAYVWRFVGGRPIVHRPRSLSELRATSRESDAMSADMKRRGFSFCGSTICYAYLQAAGLVDDHVVQCFRKRELAMYRRSEM